MLDQKKGIYRHFKGNYYELVDIARDSETLEEMVIYRALYGDGGLWVRNAKMWDEEIERDGKIMKRFEFAAKTEDEIKENVHIDYLHR